MRVFFILALLSTIVLSGCGSRDQAYYQSNLDDAEAKLADCSEAMKAAFTAADEESLKAVLEDQECKFAEKAVRERNKKVAELERKAAKEKFNAEYENQLASLAEMTYAEFMNISTECDFMFSTPKCKAFSQLEKQRQHDEVKLLLDKYSGGELEVLHKPCEGIWPLSVSCSLSNAALRSAMDIQTTFFLENREGLVSAFNLCQKQIESLNKANKYSEGVSLASTFNCSTASTAAQKLGVWGFSAPIKL